MTFHFSAEEEEATRALVGEFSMSSWGHISMSAGRDYACWRNNFQIMQILRVLCEPQFIRSIVVHPSIVVKWLNTKQSARVKKQVIIFKFLRLLLSIFDWLLK